MSDIPPPPPPGGGMPPPPSMGVPGPAASVPIGDAFGYAWKKFTADIGPWILMALAVLVIAIVGEFIIFLANAIVDNFFVGWIVRSIFSGLLLVLIYAAAYGLVRASLLATEGERPNPSKAFQMDQFGPYLIASIIVAAITSVGYFFCIIPGVIAQFLLMFTPFFVIDKKRAPMDAVKDSFNLVKTHIGGLIGFILLAWVIGVVGFLCCIGTLIAFPVILIATAFVYKRLDGQPIAA
jgi:uncharacterized membrane protein